MVAIALSQLFFQEAGLQHDAAAVNLAVNLFGILGQADALHFGASLDNHRRTLHFQILDNGNRIAIEQFGAIAILGHIGTCRPQERMNIEFSPP